MKQERSRGCLSIPCGYQKKLRKAVLFSFLTFSSVAVAGQPDYLSVRYAGEQPMEYAYQDNSGDLPSRYRHDTWWIAGIGAASAAAMVSSIDNDKKQHFAVSVALGAASEFGLRQLNIASDSRWERIALATGIGLIPGVIKEVADDKFDKQDLLADAVGSFTGALLSDLIQGPVQSGSQYGVVVGVDGVRLVINHPF